MNGTESNNGYNKAVRAYNWLSIMVLQKNKLEQFYLKEILKLNCICKGQLDHGFTYRVRRGMELKRTYEVESAQRNRTIPSMIKEFVNVKTV